MADQGPVQSVGAGSRCPDHTIPLNIPAQTRCFVRSEPSLLNLTERRIRHNFEGIQEALKLTAQQATSLVRNHPTVLRASMALLRERHAMLRQLLQVRGQRHT